MQTWALVFTRARGEDVSFRDVKIKIPDKTWRCEWRHAPEACAEDFGGFEKSQLSRVGQSEGEGWHSLARSGLVAGATRVGVGRADGKTIIERLCISLPYVETINSKVIKGFVPELRSRYVFFVFQDSYVLCIYVMNILRTFHISVSGYVTFCIVINFLILWSIFLSSSLIYFKNGLDWTPVSRIAKMRYYMKNKNW